MDDKKEFKYNCINCNYSCNENSKWEKHINTVKHLTGHKKIRSDCKAPNKCLICKYETKNNIIFKQHNLNYHSNKEEREKEYNYYCKLCDFGTFYKNLFEKHNLTEKHKKYECNIK